MILKNLLLHQIWLVHKNQARPGLFISVLIVFWVQVCASWHVRERTSFTHNVRRGPCCRGLQSGFFRRHSDKLHMWRRLKVLIFRIMRTRHPSFHLRSTYDYLWAYTKPRFKPSTRVKDIVTAISAHTAACTNIKQTLPGADSYQLCGSSQPEVRVSPPDNACFF